MLKLESTHRASSQEKSLEINREQLRLTLTKWTDYWLSIRESSLDDVTRSAEERICHVSMLSRSYGRVLYMANQLTRHDVNRIADFER